MPLGIGYFFHGLVDVFSHSMRHRVFGFIVSFIPFVTRHMGVSTLQGIGLRITEDHGISG